MKIGRIVAPMEIQRVVHTADVMASLSKMLR